jgi:DNA-binding NarL/FixJ family response regulator
VKRTIFIYATLVISLLCLLKLGQYAYISGDISIEIGIAIIAMVFFSMGLYINRKSYRKKPLPPEKTSFKKISELGLSKREYEVLQEISLGLSNREIAEKLFVSESTVKTHVSNILVKLDAKRRTQAIQRAKEFEILPI